MVCIGRNAVGSVCETPTTSAMLGQFMKMKKTIDEQNQILKNWDDKILKNWIERNYGKKCITYNRNCPNCKAWKCYNELNYLIDEVME